MHLSHLSAPSHVSVIFFFLESPSFFLYPEVRGHLGECGGDFEQMDGYEANSLIKYLQVIFGKCCLFLKLLGWNLEAHYCIN